LRSPPRFVPAAEHDRKSPHCAHSSASSTMRINPLKQRRFAKKGRWPDPEIFHGCHSETGKNRETCCFREAARTEEIIKIFFPVAGLRPSERFNPTASCSRQGSRVRTRPMGRAPCFGTLEPRCSANFPAFLMRGGPLGNDERCAGQPVGRAAEDDEGFSPGSRLIPSPVIIASRRDRISQ